MEIRMDMSMKFQDEGFPVPEAVPLTLLSAQDALAQLIKSNLVDEVARTELRRWQNSPIESWRLYPVSCKLPPLGPYQDRSHKRGWARIGNIWMWVNGNPFQVWIEICFAE